MNRRGFKIILAGDIGGTNTRKGESLMRNKAKSKTFPSAFEDARAAELYITTPQTLSPSYRLAYMDHDFLMRDELRPVRLELELLKPELILFKYVETAEEAREMISRTYNVS